MTAQPEDPVHRSPDNAGVHLRLRPVFTWRVTRNGTLLAEGANPTQPEAIGFLYEALLNLPPGAKGVVRAARWPQYGRDYVYDPPTVEAERAAGGVMLRHPGPSGGLPSRPQRRLRRRRRGGST